MAKDKSRPLSSSAISRQPYVGDFLLLGNNDQKASSSSSGCPRRRGGQRTPHRTRTLANKDQVQLMTTTTSRSSHNTKTTIHKQTKSPASDCFSGPGQTSETTEATTSTTVPAGRRGRRSRSKSNPRRRFQLRSSTLSSILSSTFKDLSLGYYLSILMVISFKIFIFANTLNTVMGAKTFYMHWNTSNSIFRIDNTDHIIDVNKGNLAFEYDQVHIICPVYEPGTFDNETEKLIIYNVSKAEYETCRITNANPRIIAVCDKPQKLMYFTITFRPFTPSPGGLEFLPGHDYYFISTSSKDDLHRRIGGRCSTNNMKVVFKVCCGGGGGGTSDQGGSATIGGADSNRTLSPGRGTSSSSSTKKALAVTTPQPSVKIWSVPSSPAVVSHRPTLNQPVVLQNDFVVPSTLQNHSYNNNGGGASQGGGGSNWQSSTIATKKTLKPSDFDKRANEVVKYDQELNVNEKSTTNEMVGGDAVSWQRHGRGGLLVVAVSGAVVLLRQRELRLY